MKTYRLCLTPQTAVRANQGDSVLFRIPSECPYTLKQGNMITVAGKGKIRPYKAVVVDVDLEGERRVVKVRTAQGKTYSVNLRRIVFCDGVDCRHKISHEGKRRVTRLIRYNDYKEALLTEARRLGFDMPMVGTMLVFYLPMPERWNKSLRRHYHLKCHQRKPDTKNLLTAWEDGLMKEDQGIAHYSGIAKVWVDSDKGWIEAYIPESLEDYLELAKKNYELSRSEAPELVIEKRKYTKKTVDGSI